MFRHFTVAPEVLPPQCAFPLDQWEGEAVVSLVAFTMRRFRFAGGGRLGAWLCWPFREQSFLNLRTYVSVQGEPGITFLAEWVSDRVQVPFGPLIYGLPYRWGRHRYEHGVAGCWNGRVTARPGEADELRYRIRNQGDGFAPARAGSHDEFLLERHTCFLHGRGRGRRFRIWHEPWLPRLPPMWIRRRGGRMKYLAALLLLAPSVALQAQSNGTVLDAASANMAGLNGQSRGIRFVTRRTSMAMPGAEARTFFTAGGVNLGAGTAATTTAPSALATVVAETWSPELQRPEVQAALRQLAAAGDPEARRLLARPKAPGITTATRPVR